VEQSEFIIISSNNIRLLLQIYGRLQWIWLRW